MARRGRNGADHNASKHKSTNSGSVDMSPSDIRENFEQKEGKVFDNEELPNGIFHGRTLSPKGKSAKKNKSSSKKSNERPDNSFRRQKPKEKTPHSSKTESIRRDADHFSLSSDSSKTPFGDNLNQGNSSGIPNGSFVEAQGFSDVIMGKNLGGLAMHVLKAANGWVEKQKPHIITFTTVIHDAHDYVCRRIKILYPIIQTWVLHFGQIMFLLSMVWLDCGLRGLSSLLHLGTTSFFAVIWCSILSVIAMVGITKMLIIMVIASLVAVFIGLALGVLIVAFSATVILWMYGSFWTTGLVTAAGAVAFALRRERVALFLTTTYSAYCAKCYVGWLGLLLGLNLSFISSDVLIYILKNYVNDQRFNSSSEQDTQSQSSANNFYSESMHAPPMEDDFHSAFGRYSGHDSGATSTSGAEAELTPENEVSRLLNCNDHYSALGFARYENIDTSSLKREYRKKAMLVHPDKNMGNEKAVEAFKKLQNAYEVLLDSLKRKTYDDELRREELLHYFRRFQGLSQKNSRHGAFSPGFSHHEHEDEGPHGESRRIACKKCNDFHIWICTNRSKSRARICQDCKAFHQAKDGDGWVEQAFQPVMFGLLHKMDPPHAYVCAESRIYDVTEWFICQGMRCPPNTHKPSFHVNTSLASKYNAKGSSSSNGGSGGMPMPNVDNTMTEEEFFEWLQNAMQSGTVDSNSMSNESPSARTGAFTKNSCGKKKRRGKKQW